jgi:HK97 family phage major capsid protein
MAARTWTSLSKIKDLSSGSNKALLQESAGAGTAGIERRIYGIPAFVSSQLSTEETQGTSDDASSAYVFQADQIVLVRRSEVRVELDSSRRFHEDRSEIRALARFDVVVPNPAAVVRIAGIRP